MKTPNKRILILHGENTYNYGSFMMLINFISYYAEEANYGCEFLVRMDSNNDYERLLKELDNKKITVRKFAFKDENKRGSFFQKITGLKNKFISQVNEIKSLKLSGMVILGGDDLSEYYKGAGIFTDLLLIKLYTTITKVFLVGQTMGPFFSWRKKLSVFCFHDATVITREKGTFNYLKNELGFRGQIYASNDLAFLDLPNKSFSKKILPSGVKEYVTIVPSGLWHKYDSNIEDYFNFWLQLIKKIRADKSLSKYHLVLFAHVLKPAKSDDRLAISKIRESLGRFDQEKIIYIEDEMLASEARHVLGNSLMTITGRMHPAISSFQQGVPAISVSYSIKYDRIIGENLDLKESVFEYKNYEQKERVSLMMKKINNFVKNHSSIKKKIVKNVNLLKKDAKNIFQIIKVELEENENS